MADAPAECDALSLSSLLCILIGSCVWFVSQVLGSICAELVLTPTAYSSRVLVVATLAPKVAANAAKGAGKGAKSAGTAAPKATNAALVAATTSAAASSAKVSIATPNGVVKTMVSAIVALMSPEVIQLDLSYHKESKLGSGHPTAQ